jgi:cell division protein FtsB
MDLLPSQYKCVPRDWTAIFILVIVLLAIPAMWFGLKKYHDYAIEKIGKANEEEIKELGERINTLTNEIAQLDNQLSKAMLKREQIKEINERIDFFNRIYQKSFSWYEFFDKLEKMTPNEVWIQKIEIVGDTLKEQRFKVTCESKEPYHAPEFLKNLMQNREFVPPADDQNSVLLGKVELNKDSGYEFVLEFKFFPFKKLEVEPEKLLLHLNGDAELKAFSVNIAEQKKQLMSGSYNVDVVNLDGNVAYEPVNGRVRALKIGKGFIKISTPDKKFTETVDYEVVK